MKEKIIHYSKEILSFFLIMTLFANLLSYYKSTELNKNKLPIKHVTLVENMPYTIKKGEPILIHFWATWCPTCELEANNIERLSNKYAIVSFAVKSGSNAEIQAYMKMHHLSYPVVNDQFSIYAKELNVSAFPSTFIYNKAGNLVFADVGYTSTLGLMLRMWWASL